jgi:hypothetical protein
VFSSIGVSSFSDLSLVLAFASVGLSQAMVFSFSPADWMMLRHLGSRDGGMIAQLLQFVKYFYKWIIIICL